MIDPKCNDLDNAGTSIPNGDKQQPIAGDKQQPIAGDKQQPIAAKKIALRDLQNDNRIVVPKSSTAPVKDPAPTSDVTKVSGTKRPTSERPTSPVCHLSPNNANGTFVYIRRKSDQEVAKGNNCENATNKNISNPQLSQNIQGEKETTRQHIQVQVQGQKNSGVPAAPPMPVTVSSGGPSVPHSLGMHVNMSSASGPTSTTGVLPSDTQRRSDQSWKERFPHLQMFLRNCDHSSQEEYIQMLKSLSSVGRSRHAVELEKRAIQLLLEEGKELNRMKLLNVLTKTSSKNSPTTPQVNSGK